MVQPTVDNSKDLCNPFGGTNRIRFGGYYLSVPIGTHPFVATKLIH